MGISSISIKVIGKVQGVFFRVSTLEIVKEIGDIKGFVKNQSDGTVLIKAQGPNEKVNKLIKWCKEGPEYAIVDHIDVQDVEKFDMNDFVILK